MNKVMTLSVLCCFAAGATGVAAEETRGSGIIEEIVVTSTYRETKLMDTPGGISAINDTMIEELGAQSMEDIFTMVPGLNMTGSNTGQNRFTIRGVTSQGGDPGYVPAGATVGVYVDGVPVTSALGPDEQISGTLFDIDRVEVLKGPQGTLFGEGSQSGTIRYLYKQPDPTGFDLAANASIAQMAESDDLSNRLDAMINIPFSDSVALRITGWRSETAGFVDNLTPLEEDYNTGESTGGRAALRFEGESFSVTGTIFRSKQETKGGVATFRAYEALYARLVGLEPESLDELDIFSLAVEVDFGWATLQSHTSYTDREIGSIIEATALEVKIFDYFFAGSFLVDPTDPSCLAVSILCPGFPGILNLPPPLPPTFIGDGMNLLAQSGPTDSYSKRWVQEIRLVSPSDQRLRWILGAFWKDSEDHTGISAVASVAPGREAFGAAFAPFLTTPANNHTDILEEYSVFGELSYDILENLELTVGVRVSDLTQEFSTTGTGTDDTPVSPKLVLSWRPHDDVLVFASYTTGFRPGNVSNNVAVFIENQRQFRLGVVADPTLTDAERAAGLAAIDQLIAEFEVGLFFDGDEVHSYELGVKSTLWDGRATVSASAYYLDWQDMIVTEPFPILGDVYNVNSGSADIKGIELEMNAFVTERFSIRVAGDLNDTKRNDDVFTSDGNELTFSPNRTLSVALDYSLPIANGWTMDFHLDRAWVSDQFVDSANTTKMPSYKKTNGRMTVRSADEKWRVALFVNNLENDEILRSRTATTATFFWATPRQVGLEVGYELGD